jgi:hypothetical protein
MRKSRKSRPTPPGTMSVPSARPGTRAACAIGSIAAPIPVAKAAPVSTAVRCMGRVQLMARRVRREGRGHPAVSVVGGQRCLSNRRTKGAG